MHLIVRSLLLAGTALAPLGAFANPLDGKVTAGTAAITGQGTANVQIQQSTEKAIINWRSFDIGVDERTRFIQPGTDSVTLNRVTGGLGASTIDGTLKANGNIFLVNPDGILFGPTSIVDTGGLVATTSDIADDDFIAGHYVFTRPGRRDASVINQGRITIGDTGIGAFVAPGVRNAGIITANLGDIGLTSANGFTLDFYGDELIKLTVGDEVAAQVTDLATGKKLDALVKNEGVIKADGGRVALTATAARAVVDSVINNTGVIEANSVGVSNGKIVLGAATAATKPEGAPVQTVKVSGVLSAAGDDPGESGGTVEISGESIEVAGVRVDASGYSTGGTVHIGGDVGGGNPNWNVVPLPRPRPEASAMSNATSVAMDAASTIDASSTHDGSGGEVVLWADDAMRASGTILARGGELGGDGGFIEVSGGNELDYSGLLANIAAPLGSAGTVLFDPVTLAPITAANVGTITSILNQGNGATAIVYGGSVSIETNIIKTAGSSATLKVFGDDGVTIASGVIIGSTRGALNILLDADANFNFDFGGFPFDDADPDYPGSTIPEISQFGEAYYIDYLLDQFEEYLASNSTSARAALLASAQGQQLLPFARQFTNAGIAEADQSVLNLPANVKFYTNGGSFNVFENGYRIDRDTRSLQTLSISQVPNMAALVQAVALNIANTNDTGAVFGGCDASACYLFTSRVDLGRIASTRANGQRSSGSIAPAPAPATTQLAAVGASGAWDIVSGFLSSVIDSIFFRGYKGPLEAVPAAAETVLRFIETNKGQIDTLIQSGGALTDGCSTSALICSSDQIDSIANEMVYLFHGLYERDVIRNAVVTHAEQLGYLIVD